MIALFWSSTALLLVGLRMRYPWIEPLPGEQYLLDGRLVTVEGTTYGGSPFLFVVVTPHTSRKEVEISAWYWRRRARPAASDPPQLRDVTRAAGGDR